MDQYTIASNINLICFRHDLKYIAIISYYVSYITISNAHDGYYLDMYRILMERKTTITERFR